jgi:hypothetical protein
LSGKTLGCGQLSAASRSDRPGQAQGAISLLRRAGAELKVKSRSIAAIICRIKQSNALISQRSLHNAPIFRLLLKVAVNGTHQCDFLEFLGGPWAPTRNRIAVPVVLLGWAGLFLPQAFCRTPGLGASPAWSGPHCRPHAYESAAIQTEHGNTDAQQQWIIITMVGPKPP